MALMSQDDGSSSVTTSPLQLGSSYLQFEEDRGLCLIHLLFTSADQIASGRLESANTSLDQISRLASPHGDAMQRLAAYFAAALAGRVLKTWPGLHRALNCTRIAPIAEEYLARKLLFELCPFLKLAFLITTQAIMEAMEGEKMVHVIDLNASDPSQWVALLQGLSARPGGPPHLRITGVHAHQPVLDQTARRLITEAEKLDIPFQFSPIVGDLENLDIERLHVKTGEALAVSSVLRLHSLLASDEELLPNRERTVGKACSPSPDSTSSSPPSSLIPPARIDGFLDALRRLSPKVVMVTEQDADHNGSSLVERVTEALHFYAALFDCLEVTVPRSSAERVRVEKMVYGEEINNIVACEGGDRRARHEKFHRWHRRFDSAGFAAAPLSCRTAVLARRALRGLGCDGYAIKEDGGRAVICWQDRGLFTVSGWRCKN